MKYKKLNVKLITMQTGICFSSFHTPR
uniref:Uncharacterized protein n=1 Tax=Lepeophtheirus salmonis TaxID=72036 RepID=A0A0K2UQC5_LEPSM